jgi:glutamate-1-semialdehyde 2,1-aminomutase
MSFNKSKQEFQRAQKSITGGVNSPARAMNSVKADPIFIDRAKGSKMWDIDGNEYIDYVGSWGPMILGHAQDDVLENIRQTSLNSTSFGAPTVIETEMAELVKEMLPSMELVRMVNSGTEATMSALRLARGYTGRELIVKFEGCYHGHADSLLIKAGSGAMTLALPDSPGVTKGTAKDTLSAEFNNLDSVKALFEEKGKEIAAVIVEPVPGNMGVMQPKPEFLQGLRDITKEYGTVLIFDEVMSGFRVAKGSAQELYGITPDLTTFGKIIGGGLPVGAYGGKREIMEQLAPAGPVYQAGTLSGNPLAMSAGYTTLKILKDTPNFYKDLDEKAAYLEEGLLNNIKEAGIKAKINRVGSMITLFFTEGDNPQNYADAAKCDTEKFRKYYMHCLENGVYWAPSQFESNFVSIAHSKADLDKTIAVSLEAMKQL